MNNQMVYFLFSTTGMNAKKQIQEKIGKRYTPGLVLTSGVYKQYTEMVSDPKLAKYPDSILVASGLAGRIKYKKPSN